MNAQPRPLRIAIATLGRFHVLDLARELAALGHDVRFYSYVPKRRAVRFGLPARCHVALLPVVAPLLGLIRFLSRTPLQPRLDALLYRAVDHWVARHLQPCDVFIGMSTAYVAAPLQARRTFGAKVIVERGSVHVRLQQQILDEVWRLGAKAKPVPRDNIERELADYHMADKIVVPSLHAERSFIERGVPPEKVFRNPYGVDLSMFQRQPGSQRDPHLILFVGGWTYQKGVDVLVRAMSALTDDGFRLCHVGGVGDAPMPEAAWFQSAGSVDQSKLAAWYSRAGCLVLPSRQEGLSLVQIQALACACPVVGTTMTGAADLEQMLPSGGMVQVVRVGDAAKLAHAIRRAASAPPAGENVRTAMRELLSWQAYARRYDAMLRDLAQPAVSTSATDVRCGVHLGAASARAARGNDIP